MIEVREYIDGTGRSPFGKWLRALNVQSAAKVATVLERIADGNLSNVKTVGVGVLEYRMDFGPGYRITSAARAIGLSSCSQVEPRR